MKSAQSLVGLYPHLKPYERARLTLGAMARRDAVEVERLRRTCPRRRYEQPDEEYLEQVNASRLVAADFAILWQEAHHDLVLAELVLEKHVRQRAVLANRAEHGDETIVDLALTFPESAAANAIAARAAVLQATHDGLVRFSEAVGIDVDALLVWYAPIADSVRDVVALLPANLPSDVSRADFVFHVLCLNWPALAEGAALALERSATSDHGIDESDRK